jgi:hypothetical protein
MIGIRDFRVSTNASVGGPYDKGLGG